MNPEETHLETALWQRLEAARTAYERATAEWQRLTTIYFDLCDARHADGSLALQQAMHGHRRAREEYEGALNEFSDFVLKARHASQGERSDHSRPGGSAPTSETESINMLTDREREVLKLIAGGCSTKEAAANLGITFKTAASHRYRLMDKLEIHNTAELVRFAIRAGLI